MELRWHLYLHLSRFKACGWIQVSQQSRVRACTNGESHSYLLQGTAPLSWVGQLEGRMIYIMFSTLSVGGKVVEVVSGEITWLLKIQEGFYVNSSCTFHHWYLVTKRSNCWTFHCANQLVLFQKQQNYTEIYETIRCLNLRVVSLEDPNKQYTTHFEDVEITLYSFFSRMLPLWIYECSEWRPSCVYIELDGFSG